LLACASTGVVRSTISNSQFRRPIRHCGLTGRANARPMTGSAKQSTSRRKERMDCFVTFAPLRKRFAFVAGNDGGTHLRILAARYTRGFSKSLSLRKQRAQGKPSVRCTRSRACSVVNTRVSHHEFTGNIRLSPRNGFNGFFRALPGDRALLPPSSADHSANLTPASGCQDHTTSPSASVSFARTLSCTDTVASTASRTQRP
jgi:hypothetical protein